MRSWSILFLFFSTLANAQVYDRLLTLKLGYTSVQLDHLNIVNGFNDTSETHSFELVTQMPSIAYSHELRFIGNAMSLSGCLGWQYMNIYYDHKPFGTQYFFLSAEPKLTIVERKKFDYYVKLKAGISVWTHKFETLSGQAQRLFPGRTKFFTGVTLIGLNLFLDDHWGLNTEVSILSPELVTFGATYRFYSKELPKIQGQAE
jgi:hypothetical protein